jgi:chromosome partitioning protein
MAGSNAMLSGMNQPSHPKPAPKHGHIIVIGNEKGGSGKTTASMHLIISLLRLGFNVGSMDIDARQRSLTRYIENRQQTMRSQKTSLPMPRHVVVNKSPYGVRKEAEADERDRFIRALAKLLVTCDVVVIDSPGNDTYMSRLAHSLASTVITPINDSFVDLDVLATIDGMSLKILKPSIYSEMLWEQKLQRAKRDGASIEWIVMRNRLSNLDARNKRMITKVMDQLSKRLGFRLAPGFSERVIYREMFLLGLTVLDVMETSNANSISMSHLAARHEVRDLLKSLKIPFIDARIAQLQRHGNNEDIFAARPKTEPTTNNETPTANKGASGADASGNAGEKQDTKPDHESDHTPDDDAPKSTGLSTDRDGSQADAPPAKEAEAMGVFSPDVRKLTGHAA